MTPVLTQAIIGNCYHAENVYLGEISIVWNADIDRNEYEIWHHESAQAR